MRMMLRITIPTEDGNRAIKDGSLPKLLEGCPFRKPYPGRIRRNYGIGACSRAMVAILRLADRGATQLFYVARAGLKRR
jgi:hypothetical protein